MGEKSLSDSYLELTGPDAEPVVVVVDWVSLSKADISSGSSTCLKPNNPPASGIGDTVIDRETTLLLPFVSVVSRLAFEPFVLPLLLAATLSKEELLVFSVGAGERGLSEAGGTGGGGEGVLCAGTEVLEGEPDVFVDWAKVELLDESRPISRWFVLLLVSGLGDEDPVGPDWPFELVVVPFCPVEFARGINFSVTTVSSMFVGAPTFFSPASF